MAGWGTLADVELVDNRPFLHFLVVTDVKRPQFISVTLREGLDFIDDIQTQFGDFYVCATEATWADGSERV